MSAVSFKHRFDYTAVELSAYCRSGLFDLSLIHILRTAAAAINDAADTLSEMFSGETAEAPAKPTEPVPTKEDVRAILAEMSSRGFTAQVKELLRQHGAATLSGIDPTEYAALIKDAEGLENG